MNFSSIFAGKMLGDAYLNCSHSAVRFAFIHALKDKDYAEHSYNLFAKFLPFNSNGIKVEHIYDKRTNKTYSRVFCQSRTSPLLNEMYSMWYRKNRKVIPKDWLEKSLTSEGLAIWFQDDGCLKNNGNRIILSTESFTEEEKDFLLKVMKKKFLINASIDTQGRIDISRSREVRKFQALVEPYIHKSMKRKSINNRWQHWEKEWREVSHSKKGICRTSIYLPDQFYHSLKGKEYSNILNNLLDKWLDKEWNENLLNPDKRYLWLLNHDGVQKGSNLLTPRFERDIKKRLDIIAEVTGFERSELVIMALKE
ncbi:MAG: endonuclease [Clostridiales bacterium]|jgi:hypothetical protein|nr:endonuclease [Clostridiales bacterium]